MDNEELIQQWFLDYHDDVYNYLVYYFGKRDVEDFVQEAFLKAYQHIGKYEARSNPKTWLISIARNVAIDDTRKNKWNRFLPTALLAKLSSHENTPLDHVLLDETKQELYKEIRNLKPAYRDVVILRGIMQLSPEETAAILGWNQARVNLAYHRAIKALQNMYSPKGGAGHAAIND